MRNKIEFDSKIAELVAGIPTAFNQTGYHLTATELARFNFNGKPKKAERLPKVKDKTVDGLDRYNHEGNFAP